MKKIKAFFANKWTKIVSWIVLALSAVALIICGANIETLNGGIALVAGTVTAVSALIAFLSCHLFKEEKI